MPYRILLTKQVEKHIHALPHQVASRIEQHIDALHTDPRPPGVKKFGGQTRTYRVRVGNWRIIYTIDDRTQEIMLLTIDDRKDVYR
ncbi:MAG: type II toxin-antitoxin system RelE/ParE family toxin [Ktedonobacteraceae bacterium]